MQDPGNNDLLAKWLDGSLPDEEAKGLGNAEELAQLRASLERVGEYGFQPMDEAVLLEKTIQKRKPQKTLFRRLMPGLMKAAAAILLILGLAWWLLDDGATYVIAQAGEKQKVSLPAQSEVILNAGTELQYFADTWDVKRRLKLEGEAFFNVTKGKAFIVETVHGSIRVLGTQFNIHDRGKSLVVSCYEGSVKVILKNSRSQFVLNRGEGFIIKKTGFEPIIVEGELPLWLQGTSVFKRSPLDEVFGELERQYDLSINFSHVDLSRNFSGEFPHNDLKGALDRICGAMGLVYEINNRQVDIRKLD